MKSQKFTLILLALLLTINTSYTSYNPRSEYSHTDSPTAMLNELMHTSPSLRQISTGYGSPIMKMVIAEKTIEGIMKKQAQDKEYLRIYASMISNSPTLRSLENSSDSLSPKTNNESQSIESQNIESQSFNSQSLSSQNMRDPIFNSKSKSSVNSSQVQTLNKDLDGNFCYSDYTHSCDSCSNSDSSCDEKS